VARPTGHRNPQGFTLGFAPSGRAVRGTPRSFFHETVVAGICQIGQSEIDPDSIPMCLAEPIRQVIAADEEAARPRHAASATPIKQTRRRSKSPPWWV
jgi:hypothetical protein